MSAASDEVGAWLDKAREDLEVARLIHGAGASASLAAYHCQQSVEKCLKALLVARGLEPPKIHDLEELAARLPVPLSDVTAEELRRLTGYAVAPRYPYFPVEEAERELPQLLGIAQRVLAAAESSTRA